MTLKSPLNKFILKLINFKSSNKNLLVKFNDLKYQSFFIAMFFFHHIL